MRELRSMVAILALAALAAPSFAQNVFTANLDAGQAGARAGKMSVEKLPQADHGGRQLSCASPGRGSRVWIDLESCLE